MKLDVVICTYNRAGMLKSSVQSVLDSSVPEGVSLEILVVDNNSTDGTAGVVKGLAESTPVRIKYLFEARQGKSHALNTALENVTGDAAAFIDDDITVDKGWIRGIVSALERYPRYDCFGGKVIAVYPGDIPDWLDLNGSMRFLKSVYFDLDNGDSEVEYGYGTVSKTPGGGNMFLRRGAIEKNGPFRGDLGPRGVELGFSEDTEYCQRFLERGEGCMYIPSAVVYHPVHAERLNRGYLLKWLYRCGRSEVKRIGGYKDTAKVLGVPRYVFKKIVQHAAGSIFSVNTKKRYYHRFRLSYTAGEFVEHLRMNRA